VQQKAIIRSPRRRVDRELVAASGHAAAEPTIPLMKSRRRIAFLKA
jgi:hypothetical protein